MIYLRETSIVKTVNLLVLEVGDIFSGMIYIILEKVYPIVTPVIKHKKVWRQSPMVSTLTLRITVSFMRRSTMFITVPTGLPPRSQPCHSSFFVIKQSWQ